MYDNRCIFGDCIYNTVTLFLTKTKMKTAWIILLSIWLLAVMLTSCARAWEVGEYNEFMARQVESVYLERANYIREVDLWYVEYNPNMDKSLGIEIDLLCSARGRTMSQCWYQFLFTTGREFIPYRWW